MNGSRGSARSTLSPPTPPLDLERARVRFREALGLIKMCVSCREQRGDVKARPSRTAFEWDGKGPDPNADILLCDPCAGEYASYMDDLWQEYRTGLM